MADLYLYDDVPVLRNSLGIKDENTLDRIEAEQSRANMMLLYERGFHDFTPSGLCEIHHFLFGDLYDWAGKYRIINIEKRERLLAGRSVWYSNDEEIPNDLESAFSALYQPNWDSLTREQFVSAISRCFPRIWQEQIAMPAAAVNQVYTAQPARAQHSIDVMFHHQFKEK